MDDIIDLELEKIERIMAKIDLIRKRRCKAYRKRLWQKIYKKSGQGRRTGVGITAEGDMLAALGLRYGTEEATEFAEKVHQHRSTECIPPFCEMAKERGASKYADSEREKNNLLINRLRQQRPGTVRGNEETWPPQHCLSHHRTDRYDKPDDANHFRHRTRICRAADVAKSIRMTPTATWISWMKPETHSRNTSYSIQVRHLDAGARIRSLPSTTGRTR